MPTRVYLKDVTEPPGSTAAAPTATAWQLENATLKRVEIRVPDGHAGLTGIRIKRLDVQIVPWSVNTFLRSNDEVFSYDVGMYVDRGSLTIETYNTDIFDHTFSLRAILEDYNPQAASSSPAPAPDTSLEIGVTTPDPLSPDALLTEDQTAFTGEDEIQQALSGTV